ncbi:HprK-related kinase A [Dechloromonas denitrificans]|nr:HprK-related kinase A [Dechloromonas denitrificans]
MSPFVVRVRSDISELAEDIGRMYQDFPVLSPNSFADFHVEVSYERGIRRWVRPLARFYFDGRPSFIPLPVHQAFPMLEWGINWCVAAHSHSFLIVHAAVIERQGMAVVMPAPPGSGKSTLCAALINRGWRLLSDELALYDSKNKQLYGMARPVSLKNQSIPVIQAHTPAAEITLPVPDTTKGTVALLRPPSESVQQVKTPARPTWIVLPRYQADAEASLESLNKGKAFMLIAEQSFNYNVHGREGFEAVGDLVDSCECFEFTYSRLSDAERVFDDLLASQIKG